MEKGINRSGNVKCISSKSFVADINTLKMPLFMYSNFKQKRDSNGSIIPFEEKKYTWIDSNNKKRELVMICKKRLPRQFESDTLHGLLGLFVKKHGPFPYNSDTRTYEIEENSLCFSWYELCSFMNIQPTGYYIEKLKEAIRIMKQTQYFSYEEGSLYDKQNNKYIFSGEEGMSLISKYKFKSLHQSRNDEYSSSISTNRVVFDELIINNLRYEYFKYLDADLYFKRIPSGIERGIYGYLESNKYDNKNKQLRYIKRSFKTLRIGIPVEFTYQSELKRKISKPLQHLKEINYLRDWAFGDEIKINGRDEDCIYFTFDISISELKTMLEAKECKVKQLAFNEVLIGNQSDSDKPYLKLPESTLVSELVSRMVDKNFAEKSVKNIDKWDIITYILWVDKQKYLDKQIRDTGALLSFALRSECRIQLSEEYRDILDFVAKSKMEEKSSEEERRSERKNQYVDYVEEMLTKFKATPEYKPYEELILSFHNGRIDNLISQMESQGNDVSKYKDFKIRQEKSDYFNELLIKELRMLDIIKDEKNFV